MNGAIARRIPIVAVIMIAPMVVPLPADSYGIHWRRNSFPGAGHLENSGPWGAGRGAGRCEKIVAFAVSPVDADFMLMMTDNGPLVYSNDGEEFFPADIPFRGGQNIAFHAHDGGIGHRLCLGR